MIGSKRESNREEDLKTKFLRTFKQKELVIWVTNSHGHQISQEKHTKKDKN